MADNKRDDIPLDHIEDYSVEHFKAESPQAYSIKWQTSEEKGVLMQLADLLLEERLLTAEEWMRLSHRIAQE